MWSCDELTGERDKMPITEWRPGMEDSIGSTPGRDSATRTKFRLRMVSEAASAFFGNLPVGEPPAEPAVRTASERVRLKLVDSLVSEDGLEQISAEVPNAAAQSALRLSFENALAPLALPAPQLTPALEVSRVAVAAAVGALAGLVLLAPFSLLILGSRDAGILVGPPLGAFALTLTADWASRNKWLKAVLIGALGVATIGEVWRLLSGGTPWRKLWRRLAEGRSAVKRILTYVGILLILLVSKRRPVYDRDEYERVIRTTVEHWLEGALILLSSLVHSRKLDNDNEHRLVEDLTRTLGVKLRELHATPPEALPVAADELLHEAASLGFGGIAGPPLFLSGAERAPQSDLVWSVELSDRYDRFGHIEPGDEVTVEREPVLFRDRVKEKGLVRKVHRRP